MSRSDLSHHPITVSFATEVLWLFVIQPTQAVFIVRHILILFSCRHTIGFTFRHNDPRHSCHFIGHRYAGFVMASAL